MAIRQLYRTQYSVPILTSGTLLAPGNDRRIALILAPPLPIIPDYGSASVIASAVSSAVIGPALSFTVPGGRNAILESASYHLIGGTAPVVQLTLTRSGNTVVVGTMTSDVQLFTGLPLTAGDVITINVSAAGAGSTIDAVLGIRQAIVDNHVTVSFTGPVLLDAGLNLYPGDAPLVISGEHIGQAFREEVWVTARIGLTVIGMIDISEIDCPCQQ